MFNSTVPADFPDRKSAEFRERPLAAKPVSGIFIVVLMMGTIFVNMSGTAIVQAAPNGPLRVHPTNPIYFTDNSGKAIRLGGHQIFNDMQDHTFSSRYTYNYATTLDWNWYLNFATARNINYIRGWTLFSFGNGATASDPAIYTQPLPYARSGPGTAIDGRPKFDLNTFNQAFFDQMYSRINSAGQRGIYVSIMLFDVFNFLNNGRTRPNSMWDGNPYYSANNINSINTDTDGDGNGTEFFTTSNQTWLNYQKAYIRKVIDTVNSLDNVIYEVANEVTSPAWQEEIVAYIKTYEAGKPKQHLILRSPGTQNVGGDQEFEAKSSVLNTGAHIYAIANWGETNNTEGKPGIWDMDHTVPGSTDHKFPWKAFTRGYHFNLYDAPFEDPAQESAAWERVRYNVRATNTYAGRFNNLAAMTPQSNLASTSYCLADAGNEYIVFQPDSSSSFTVYGLIPGRQYSYEWFNTSTYSVTGTGNVTPSGSSYSFTPSYTGAVLYLRSSAMISVAAPNSGEIWPIGSTRTVTWSSTGSVGNVDIELSTDGGSSWRPALVANTANDGSQAIVVPDAFSKTCRMRVKQNSGGSPADTSDANFTITLGGDATLDGYVDGLDFSILLTNWHTSGKSFTAGDFTGDGYVDGLDFSILLTNWHVRATPANIAKGPLRIHPTNSRYFTDGTGKAIYLTGFHTWGNLQDSGASVGPPITTDPPPVFNYEGYLNLLQANNNNFIRFWRQETPKSNYGANVWYIQPHPWMRSGPGTARDGKPKFNLNQFDQSYFDRLRSRAIAAGERGIYVSVMLFEGWYLLGLPDTWQYHPFHSANNINGINGDANGDGHGDETNSLQIPAVVALQKAYIRKVIDTVNDLDNVLYEIANESGVSGSTQWQYELINYIKTYQAGKPKQHLVGMTSQAWTLHADHSLLWNSPADWISLGTLLGGDVVSDPYISDPPVPPGGKVSILDTDHLGYNIYINDAAFSRAWVWKSFLRGHHPILMEDLTSSTGWIAARAAMGHTLKYANKMNLAEMTPQNSLSSTTYCLAKTGREYLVYQAGSGAFTVNLTAGTYSVEWFNPSTGVASTAGSVLASGGNQSFTPPFTGPAVLYLKIAGYGSSAASASSEASQPAGDAGASIKVNFQPTSASVPAGYLVDGGLVFGDRGNGYSYGWASANVTAVDRNSSASADQRYDTMVNLPAGGAWEIALPNGQYSVKLVCGDAGSTGTYKVNIETVPVVDAQTSNLKRWIEQSIAVVVSDGRLTISGAPGCSRAKICFVEITGQ